MQLFKARGRFTDMLNSLSRLNAELRRLDNGPEPGEKPQGVGTVRFMVRFSHGTGDVVSKAKGVLKILDEATLAGWPAQEGLTLCLPEWFASACVTEMSSDEAKRWLAWWKGLPSDEQTKAEAEKGWSLADWLYWMKPSNRQWFWWDASVLEGSDSTVVAVEVEAWPFPWGSLRWLLHVAGASAIEAAELAGREGG